MYTLVFVRGSDRLYIGYRDRKKKIYAKFHWNRYSVLAVKAWKTDNSQLTHSTLNYQIYNMNIEYIHDKRK